MFRLAGVADSTIGSAGDAHHVELPTEQPTDSVQWLFWR
jgi:hypothetical protein